MSLLRGFIGITVAIGVYCFLTYGILASHEDDLDLRQQIEDDGWQYKGETIIEHSLYEEIVATEGVSSLAADEIRIVRVEDNNTVLIDYAFLSLNEYENLDKADWGFDRRFYNHTEPIVRVFIFLGSIVTFLMIAFGPTTRRVERGQSETV